MSEKKLTQDQIDELIKQVSNKSDSENTNNNIDNLKCSKEFIEKSIKASREALSLAISSDIECNLMKDIQTTTTKNILDIIENNSYLCVRVDYVGEVKGFDLLLIKKDDALALVQKQFTAMNMEFDEDTLLNMRDSAASELMNQMIGKSASILSNDYGFNVDINTPKIKEFSDKNSTLEFLEDENKEYIFSCYQLVLNDNLSIDIFKILELEFARSLSSLLSKYNHDKINETMKLKMEDDESDIDESIAMSYENPLVDNLDFDDDISTSSLLINQNSNKLFGGEHRVDKKEQVQVYPYNLNNIKSSNSSHMFNLSINKLNDVNIELSVELGRTKKTIKEILDMGKGSIIELDKLSGEPVDLYANGTLIASGEVVIVKDYFAVKILSIIEENRF